MSASHERKQLHESEYNSHENETVLTTNSILIQTSRLLIANYFRQHALTTKHKKYAICQRIGGYCFCGSLLVWAFRDCGGTITVLCNYYYKSKAHLQRGWGEDYSMQYAVNSSEVSVPVAPKVAKQRHR